MFKPVDVTVLPGGRKVRTDQRPYADEPVAEPVKEEKPKRVRRKKSEGDSE